MLKRIFFWTLVVFFFIVAPTIIFYSLGYRFNPQRGIFVYTGSITIKSNPLNVEVFVDQVSESKSLNRINNSYHIGGIKPGEHLIEVKSSGFNSWSKKITVNSGTSTEFWNVLLTKNDYEKAEYSAPKIENFFFDPGKKLMAYIQSKNEGFMVNVLDVDSNESENVFNSEEYKFTDDKKENIEWSPQSKKIIVPVVKDGTKNYFLIDVKNKETFDLKNLAKVEKIEKVRWDQDNKDFIYYISEGNLHHLDTTDVEHDSIIAKNIASYDLSSEYVYYFQLPSGIIYRTNSNGTSDPEQITTSSPDKMSDPGYQITVYDKKRIAILNKSGDLYINNVGEKNSYFKNLASGIYEIQFSDDGKKMLFYSDWEISVYFTRDWDVQPWRSEDERKEIVRFSEKIENVQWAKKYEHVIFNVGKKIKITEIDNRSQNNISDIMNLDNEKIKLVCDFGEDKIYFMNKNGEESNLYSISFPEIEGILF